MIHYKTNPIGGRALQLASVYPIGHPYSEAPLVVSFRLGWYLLNIRISWKMTLKKTHFTNLSATKKKMLRPDWCDVSSWGCRRTENPKELGNSPSCWTLFSCTTQTCDEWRKFTDQVFAWYLNCRFSVPHAFPFKSAIL